MTSYISGRIFQGILTLFVISAIVFVLGRSAGDPAELMAGPTAQLEEVEFWRQRLGTDKSLGEQYWIYIKNGATLDFGRSVRFHQPVQDVILDRLPNSAKLGLATLIVTLLIVFTLGIAAAVKRNSPIDFIARFFGTLGLATPNFWIAILLIQLLAVQWGLLPAFGNESIKHYIIPVFVLSTSASAGMMRLLRSHMIEVLGSDFIRTARAKGLAPATVIARHAIRNALIPVITVAGIYAAHILTGSIIIETIFAWPGLGRLGYEALVGRDLALLQAVTLFTAGFLIFMNLVVDLTYPLINPRVRLGG